VGGSGALRCVPSAAAAALVFTVSHCCATLLVLAAFSLCFDVLPTAVRAAHQHPRGVYITISVREPSGVYCQVYTPYRGADEGFMLSAHL
jgi:hypothetical protein